MGIDIKNLIRFSSSGVFCFENSQDKRVYINFSSNMMGYVARVLKEIGDNTFQYRNMTHDVVKLEVKVLEVRDDIETLDYWVSQYQEQGWEIYNAQAKRPLPRAPRVMISSLDKSTVEARLYNRRGDFEVVGVFKNIPEANSFLETCYGDNNPYKLRVIAANFLTRKELSI